MKIFVEWFDDFICGGITTEVFRIKRNCQLVGTFFKSMPIHLRTVIIYIVTILPEEIISNAFCEIHISCMVSMSQIKPVPNNSQLS